MALVLAILGTGLIGLGSFVGIQAPGDGQTAMVVFPAWFLGGLMLLGAAVWSPSSVVGGLAVFALGSVGWCFWAWR